MKSLFRLAPLALLAVPLSALAQTVSVYGNSNGQFGVAIGTGGVYGLGCTTSLCYVAQNILYIINYVLVPLLFAIAFITFLYGVFKTYIWSHGDSAEVSKGHQLILWGVIGFVVMVSLWGLVNVVANTFGLSGSFAPPPPTSFGPR